MPPRKPRKFHPGAAAGIFPIPNNKHRKGTRRYWNGELDLGSIIAFITHLRKMDDMPTELIRLRGRLRNAFIGFQTNKNMIRAAYAKAGWNIHELSNPTRRQQKEARERARMESVRKAAESYFEGQD